ncbi:hypothetical protein PS726_00733 [Pseudomonas fluorescens]|uniref:DUF3077 domain-containing protein n=1 Tax=Pseudomonas fluorescens TaxID=294 RepID=A0A8H2RT41_PSEFL|nr:hypothetical protein PS861_04950 [Pseudomonas fluorescens]VVN76184.1 hypothetical protein PS726_00733 [Pseudomonas fluorescens]VVP47047.1 hypothetical protein PS900_05182 [Pseudomonas fluorescens]
MAVVRRAPSGAPVACLPGLLTCVQPPPLFTINPDIDTETLLAHACESLASANVMAHDLAGFLEGTHRNTLLGIAQVIMLGELAVNRALDQVDRPG